MLMMLSLQQTKTKLISLLKAYEDHGYQLGYRWNPSKRIILEPTLQPIPYILYNETILSQSFFSYLGIPFCPGGHTNGLELPNASTIMALSTLNQLLSIGLHSKRFCSSSPHLFLFLDSSRSTRVWSDHYKDHFFPHYVNRRCKKHMFTPHLRQLASIHYQDDAPYAKASNSTKVQLHSSIPIYFTPFLRMSLLSCLFPHIHSSRDRPQWYTLSKLLIGNDVNPTQNPQTEASYEQYNYHSDKPTDRHVALYFFSTVAQQSLQTLFFGYL